MEKTCIQEYLEFISKVTQKKIQENAQTSSKKGTQVENEAKPTEEFPIDREIKEEKSPTNLSTEYLESGSEFEHQETMSEKSSEICEKLLANLDIKVEDEDINKYVVPVLQSMVPKKVNNKENIEIIDEEMVEEEVITEEISSSKNMSDMLTMLHTCPNCAFGSSDRNEYLRHLKNVHNVQLHECPFCPSMYLHEEFVLSHMRQLHMKHLKASCAICNEKFENQALLKDHVEQDHFLKKKTVENPSVELSQLNIQNSLADIEHNDQVPTKVAKKLDDDNASIQCKHCDIVNESREIHSIHMSKKHRKLQRHFCFFCKQEFSKEIDIILHIRHQHINFHKLKCLLCDHEFKLIRNLKKHLQCSHGNFETLEFGENFTFIELNLEDSRKITRTSIVSLPNLKTGSRKHEIEAESEPAKRMKPARKPCFKIKLKDKDKNDRIKHKKIEETTKPKRLQCKRCNFVSKKRQKLLQHMNEEHKIRLNNCPYCGRIYLTILQLTKHLQKVHQYSESILCIRCNRKFKYMKVLEQHVKNKHEASGKLIPDVDFKFIEEISNCVNLKKNEIKKEYTLHRNIYKCTLCNFKTKIRKNITRHTKLHKNRDLFRFGRQNGSTENTVETNLSESSKVVDVIETKQTDHNKEETSMKDQASEKSSKILTPLPGNNPGIAKELQSDISTKQSTGLSSNLEQGNLIISKTSQIATPVVQDVLSKQNQRQTFLQVSNKSFTEEISPQKSDSAKRMKTLNVIPEKSEILKLSDQAIKTIVSESKTMNKKIELLFKMPKALSSGYHKDISSNLMTDVIDTCHKALERYDSQEISSKAIAVSPEKSRIKDSRSNLNQTSEICENLERYERLQILPKVTATPDESLGNKSTGANTIQKNVLRNHESLKNYNFKKILHNAISFSSQKLLGSDMSRNISPTVVIKNDAQLKRYVSKPILLRATDIYPGKAVTKDGNSSKITELDVSKNYERLKKLNSKQILLNVPSMSPVKLLHNADGKTMNLKKETLQSEGQNIPEKVLIRDLKNTLPERESNTFKTVNEALKEVDKLKKCTENNDPPRSPSSSEVLLENNKRATSDSRGVRSKRVKTKSPDCFEIVNNEILDILNLENRDLLGAPIPSTKSNTTINEYSELRRYKFIPRERKDLLLGFERVIVDEPEHATEQNKNHSRDWSSEERADGDVILISDSPLTVQASNDENIELCEELTNEISYHKPESHETAKEEAFEKKDNDEDIVFVNTYVEKERNIKNIEIIEENIIQGGKTSEKKIFESTSSKKEKCMVQDAKHDHTPISECAQDSIVHADNGNSLVGKKDKKVYISVKIDESKILCGQHQQKQNEKVPIEMDKTQSSTGYCKVTSEITLNGHGHSIPKPNKLQRKRSKKKTVVYKCHQCGLLYKNKSGVKKHLLSYHKTDPGKIAFMLGAGPVKNDSGSTDKNIAKTKVIRVLSNIKLNKDVKCDNSPKVVVEKIEDSYTITIRNEEQSDISLKRCSMTTNEKDANMKNTTTAINLLGKGKFVSIPFTRFTPNTSNEKVEVLDSKFEANKSAMEVDIKNDESENIRSIQSERQTHRKIVTHPSTTDTTNSMDPNGKSKMKPNNQACDISDSKLEKIDPKDLKETKILEINEVSKITDTLLTFGSQETLHIKSDDSDIFPTELEIKPEPIKRNIHFCSRCNMKLPETLYFTHMKNVHKVKRFFECIYCQSKHLTRASLTQHIETVHISGENMHCQYCHIKFLNLAILTKHIIDKHCLGRKLTRSKISIVPNEKANQNISTGVISSPKLHTSSSGVDKSSEFQDNDVSPNVSSSEHKEQQAKVTHDTDQKNNAILVNETLTLRNTVYIYKCGHCTYRSCYKYELNRHLKTVHENETNIPQCLFCEFQSNYFEVLRHMMWAHHTDCSISNCSYCIFKEQWMTRHRVNYCKFTLMNFKCDRCPWIFLSRIELKKHKQLFHEGANGIFFCLQCKRDMIDEKTFVGHLLKVHNDSTVHKCTKCDFVTTVKVYLTDHIRIYHDESSCAACEEDSNDTDSVGNGTVRCCCVTLYRSYGSKWGLKEVACSYCGRLFPNKMSLLEHTATDCSKDINSKDHNGDKNNIKIRKGKKNR